MDQPKPSFTFAALSGLELRDYPIRPEWVRAGTPHARLAEIARSADGTAVTVQWDCTVGTFDWIFGVDETVHILEGEVIVADAAGAARLLRAGDVAFFPSGSVTLWRVETYVRKLAFCRHAMPRPLGFALRAFTRLKSMLGFGPASGPGLAGA
jgi:uncharacterized cupin superfamily protein